MQAELRRPSRAHAGRAQKAAELIRAAEHRRRPSAEGRAQQAETRRPSTAGRAQQAEHRRLRPVGRDQKAELTSEGRPRHLYAADMPCSSLPAPCFTCRPRHDILIRNHTLLRLSTPHHSQECTALCASSKLWLHAISSHDRNGPSTATHYFHAHVQS